MRPLAPLFSMRDDGADDLEVAELLGGDVDQHVLATGIILGQVLGEVAARRRKFTLRTAELLEQQVGEAGIGFADANGVLKTLVVGKHGFPIWRTM